MSRADIKGIIFDHIIDGPAYRFVSVTIDGRTRNFRIYTDGTVEAYEGGRFVQLADELAREIRLLLGRTQHVPTFELHNGGGLN